MLKSITRLIPTAAVAVAAVLPLPAAWIQQQQAAPAPGQSAEKTKLERPEHAFIWKVEKAGHATSYLFGTMHVPDKRFTKFNDTVKQAFKQADGVYTELAMDVLEDPATQQKFMEASMLKDGRKLKDFISAELYERLTAVAAHHQIPMMMLDGMRPGMVPIMIENFAMLKEYGAGDALDAKIYAAAEKAGKEVGGIEVIDEQLAALGILTDQEAAQLLSKQIGLQEKNIAKGRVPLREMAEVYLSGSEEKMMNFVMEDFDANNPIEVKAMKALLDVRNKAMAERSGKKILANPDKSYVFAFGTLHFVGPNSVVEMMQANGFKVTRLTAPAAKKKAAQAVR